MGTTNIVKEVFIIILLAAAVLCTLVILLYDFMPEETEAQSQVYVQDATVAATIEELQDANQEEDTSSLLKSYTVDSSDLKSYEVKSYDKGKANPFVDLETEQYLVENTVNPAGGNVSGGNATVVSGTVSQSSGSQTSVSTGTNAQASSNTTSTTGTFFESPNSK